MKFLYSLSGANHPVIKEFRINKTDKFVMGKAVRVSTNGILGHNVIGNCLGAAAENHTGEKDILNPRADGETVRIDITHGGVYSVPVPKVSVSASSSSGFSCSSTGITTSVMGMKAVLVAKGDNSENTDSVGTERTITDASISGTTVTLTVSGIGTVSVGDVYAIVPNTGYKGYLAEDCESFSFSGGTGVDLMVVKYNEANETLDVLLGTKQFDI